MQFLFVIPIKQQIAAHEAKKADAQETTELAIIWFSTLLT